MCINAREKNKLYLLDEALKLEYKVAAVEPTFKEVNESVGSKAKKWQYDFWSIPEVESTKPTPFDQKWTYAQKS